MGEHEVPVQGPQGPQGTQGEPGARGNPGERGIPGVTAFVRRAVVCLFVFSVTIGGLGLFWTAYEVHAIQAAQSSELAAQAREQTPQQQESQAVVRALCAALARLAALKPAPGDPETNPSSATLGQQRADLGCK